MRRDRQLPIVIANAGGYAVSRVVRFLPAYNVIPQDVNCRNLLFISLNSAAMPVDYGLGSNTLTLHTTGSAGHRHNRWPL